MCVLCYINDCDTVNMGSVLTTVVFYSPGCCSDTEADFVFKMTDNTQNITYRRSVSVGPKSSASFNQFLPSKDKSSGYVPAPLRKKRFEREESRHSWASASTEDDPMLTRYCLNTHIGKYLKLFVMSAHLSLNMQEKWSKVLHLQVKRLCCSKVY